MPYFDAVVAGSRPLLDVVLLCAGESRRFRSGAPNERTKILVDLGGKPALQHLCETMRRAGFLRTAVVLPKERSESKAVAAITAGSLPEATLVEGGERRQDSLQKALEALDKRHNDEKSSHDDNVNLDRWVMVFDAARPLVSAELIARVALRATLLRERSVSACVVPLLSVSDSVKHLDEKGRVSGSASRARLGFAQTPQAAPFALLLRLLRETSATVSDEAALFQKANCLVEAVEGETLAHKLTTRADVGLLEGILGWRANTRMPEYRSATGFDIHKTCEGTSLRLCGVDVPADFSLEGHSDADVALHATTDAILSLAGAGDIGDLFPPTDARWRDADSAFFLSRALALLSDAGGALVSLDVTLLLEAPYLGGFKLGMRERLSVLAGVALARVGVKATTLEGLGAMGRREGVGCIATLSARFG